MRKKKVCSSLNAFLTLLLRVTQISFPDYLLWFLYTPPCKHILVSNELRFPETSLREYSAHGDGLSLVILIHVIRQKFAHFWKTL